MFIVVDGKGPSKHGEREVCSPWRDPQRALVRVWRRGGELSDVAAATRLTSSGVGRLPRSSVGCATLQPRPSLWMTMVPSWSVRRKGIRSLRSSLTVSG